MDFLDDHPINWNTKRCAYTGILRSKMSETLDLWIDNAIDSDIIPIMRFARVLRRDIDAVNNAIELPGATDRPKVRSTASRPSSTQCTAGQAPNC
ncbi:hypothetical protein [Mesorhizobium tamadayense]|uniref:hypothetical protein n=1 Tax=Mesorhizobium tamadayense TaxID=425306 RepID=UPI003CCB3327